MTELELQKVQRENLGIRKKVKSGLIRLYTELCWGNVWRRKNDLSILGFLNV